jgi:TetR/AcrR family transcriptional regulator, regulator of mycofactocin system
VTSHPQPRGRPPRTSREELARVALDLFSRNGFEETTLEDVADAVGVGRRTLFRYFASKNDLVWGDFDWVLARLQSHLDELDPDEPIMEGLARAVIASNHYEEEDLPELRVRMGLITTVPALQAHSMVRYAAWRHVVARHIALRLGCEPDDLVPLTVGHMALGTSMAAFVRWVAHPEEDLEAHLERGYRMLSQVLLPE